MAIRKENNGDALASAATGYSISLGDNFRGTFESADDVDWIEVELSAGTVYDIRLRGTDRLNLDLLDAAGTPVISGSRVSENSRLIIFTPDVSGTYYIEASAGFDTGQGGGYAVSIIENDIPTGTYDEVARFMTDGYKSFTGETRSAFDVEPGGVLTADITDLTEAGQRLARWALEAWTNVTGIRFEFVDEDAHITFDDADSETVLAAAGRATAEGHIISATVTMSTGWLDVYGRELDSNTFTTYMHEIGHALGLDHPGPYNGRGTYGVDTAFLIDSDQATLMSYTRQLENTYIDASRAGPVTPMIADILAIQDLYGTPANIHAGNTVYGYQSNVNGYLGQFFEIWTGKDNPFFHIDAGEQSAPAFADLDGDGDPDLITGNGAGSIGYYENTGTPAHPEFTERTGVANPLESVRLSGYSTPAIADLDDDGDPDLVIGSLNGTVAYLENTGTPTQPEFSRRAGTLNPLDGVKASAYFSVPDLADLDGDGDHDLVIGNADGTLDYFENTGTSARPAFTQRTGVTDPLNSVSVDGYSAPASADLDGDGDLDIVVLDRHGAVSYFENNGTPASPDYARVEGAANPLSRVNSDAGAPPGIVDLDSDGDLDFIAGNGAGEIVFYNNTGTADNPEFTIKSFANHTTLTLYDSNGEDTLDLRTDIHDQQIDLRPEGISDVYGLTGNLIIARDTLIENVIAGSGDDRITGNSAANILDGGAGADFLDGGAGEDWVTYERSDAGVTVHLGEGTVTDGHAEGDVLVNIEHIIGSAHDDVLTGDDDANRLEGGAGADRLDGGAGGDWVSYRLSDAGVAVDLLAGTVSGGHAGGDVIAGFEHITGSAYADVLAGDDGANRLEGGAGADTLTGGAGEDTASYTQSAAGVVIRLHSGVIRGGDAEGDTFAAMVTVAYTGSDGETRQETVPDIEHLRGSAHADTLAGDSRANRLEGGPGDDRLYGGPGGGDDVLQGGPGADALFGGIGDDVLEGGPGADTLKGGSGADTASYGQSATGVEIRLHSGLAQGGVAEGDVLDSIEHLTGSAYADTLAGDADANRLDGGGGVDWLSYADSDAGVDVTLTDGIGAGGHAEGDVFAGFENVEGSRHDDVLAGDNGDNHLAGGDGNDGLRGNGGDDVLAGGAGADRMVGGSGEDWVIYADSDSGVTVDLDAGTGRGGHAGGDSLTGIENVGGSDYDDVLTGDAMSNRLEGGAGADRLDGGSGMDWVLYLGSPAGVTVDLMAGTGAGGDAEGDALANVENITGSDYADVLTGNAGVNHLDGAQGDDVLRGNGGDDVLGGGAGADRLIGGAGADNLDGGQGLDWVSYTGSDAGVTVDLRDGTVTGGHAAGDVLAGIENIAGSGYADKLTGDNGANELAGGEGDDELRGNAGNDVLEGGAGADRLDGGAGVDTVSYRGSDAGVTVSLEDDSAGGGHAEGDATADFENVIGSAYDDVLVGHIGDNRLTGRDGDDELVAGNGDDFLSGGAGDDVLDGGAGADWIYGGEGEDWVSYAGSDSGVKLLLFGNVGTDQGGEGDVDNVFEVENAIGSAYDDTMYGDHGPNHLQGGDGDDLLNGNPGDDILEGGPGDDILDSNDYYGPGGAEIFVFDKGHGDDVIEGFGDNQDRIDLTAFNLSGFDALDISQNDEDHTLIDLTEYGGGTILLTYFNPAFLDATDFLF